MTDRRVVRHDLRTVHDGVWLAGQAMRMARSAGFDARRAGALGICVGELVSNAVKYGLRGRIELAEEESGAIRLVVEDEGPGLAQPEEAVKDGFSEGRFLTPDVPSRARRGLGVGLGAVVRLMNEVRFETPPNGGTRVIAVLRR